MSVSPVRVSTRTIGIVGIVLCTALWGSSAPMVKHLVDIIPPCTLAALRLGIAVAVLVPLLAARGRRPRFDRGTVGLGLSGVAAYQTLQTFGMERMPAGTALVSVLGASVVLTALLSRVVLGERCSPSMALAMLGCGIGVTLVAMSGGGATWSFPVVGLLLLIAAAFSWAVYAVIGRRSSEGDMLEGTAGSLVAGFVAMLPFVAWEHPDPRAMPLHPGDLVMLALLGGLVTAGSYVCWSFSIQHLQVNEANILCSVEPAFGLFFSWWLLGERVSMQAAIGSMLVVASCVLVAMGDSDAETADAETGEALEWAPAESRLAA